MKLLITGSDKVYAIENFYVKYLKRAGVEVFHFPAQSLFYDYYQRGIFNKLAYRSGLSSILNKINEKFKKQVEEFKPDLIWVFKGMEFFPETLQWAKEKGVFLINYNGDSPFIFSGKGSGNANVSGSMALYDLFLTYNPADKKQMETEMNVRSEILPFGFELDEGLFRKLEKTEEISKVCFLGNPDEIRGKFLKELAALNVKIDVFGHKWNQFVNHSNIIVYPPVYQEEFWYTLRKYRVQLNLMRPHNVTSHNMRTFEAGGAGAIQLAPDTPDHRRYFQAGEEIFLFNNVASCCEKINDLLKLPTEEANKIRRKARRRSLDDGYSYQCRSKTAENYLNNLIESQ
ncbi:MAG: CgeB family protein [Ginsengibacter sp.]